MAAAAFAAPHADTERRAGLRKEGRGRKRNRIIEMTIPDMKTRIFGALALLLWSVGAAAQNNPYVAVEGAVETGGGIVVSLPRTSIGVDIVVERDATVCGPYARYAQKYLGVRAPLTDKTVWSVASASLSLLDAQEALGGGRSPEAGPQRRVVSHTDAEEEFVRLQPDRTSAAAVAPEEAARQAAATIFALRRHRMELITGEAGEHVFGEGLRAALDEIDRLEQRYLELFLGKRTVTVETRRYVVAPQAGKTQYIVCRFSPVDGLLPENDLSGDMVLLQIEPSGVPVAVAEASAKDTNVVLCRAADPSVCTVICGGREYARAVLPVFEFGRTVRVALPRRK